MSYAFRISCFLIFSLLQLSCVSKLKSINKDEVRILEENTGYLFITLDSNISLSKFSISGTENIYLKNPRYDRGKNYYLVPVPALGALSRIARKGGPRGQHMLQHSQSQRQ